MEIKYPCYVKDGILHIRSRKAFDNEVRGLTGELEIYVIKKKKYRSLSQNAFYWSAVIPILHAAINECGNHLGKESVHKMMAAKFLLEDVPLKDGQFIQRVKSTTELSTSQFMDYLTEINAWTIEYLGFSLPAPNEQLTLTD